MKSDRKLFWKSPWADLFLAIFYCLLFASCCVCSSNPDVRAALDVALSDSNSSEALVFEGTVAYCGILLFYWLAGPCLYSAIRGFVKSKRPAAPSKEVTS